MIDFLKKRVVLTCVMTLLGLGTFATTPGVTFLLTNGSTVSFAFKANPEISVTSIGITVSAQNQQEVIYQFSEMDRFYYEDDVVTAINGVRTETTTTTKPVFCYDRGMLSISGLNASEQVAVYSLGGSKMSSTVADNAGHANVNVGNMPTGVYAVSTSSGVSFKLLKK